MQSVTISGANTTAAAIFDTDEALPFAQTLANELSEGLDNGSLTPLNYTGGNTAPASFDGVVTITTTPTTAVAIPTTDVGLFITAGPTTITGGAAGETVIAGSSGLTYTNITASGNQLDYIVAGDGANSISTSTTGTGNYAIYTGAGNDTISTYGNAVINAGTGQNSITVAGGSSLIYSEGNDRLIGSTVVGAGGTDTIDVGTGQPTISPGTSNFDIYEDSDATNPVFLEAGTGSDTVSIGGGTVYGGSSGNNILIAGAGGASGAGAELDGTTNGDQLYATGSLPVFLYAGGGSETLSAAGGTLNGQSFPGSTADDMFVAGSGNDTILGGSGSDTVQFYGPRAEYTLAAGPDGTLLVTNTGGGPSAAHGASPAVDTLSNIETLAFADETQAPCYCRGTAIATESGETPVEALRIGDLVRTASGALRRVRWIGQRSYDGRCIAGNRDILPILIRADALGPGLPRRDLLVSPKHALFLDGILVPAALLVNGVSIVQVAAVETLTYFHVELDTHDILLAEGAPAESFVDCDSRAMFQNVHEYFALPPDAVPPAWMFCAVRLEDGLALEAIRRRLGARAGLQACHFSDAEKPSVTPSFRLDTIGAARISGWVLDDAQPRTRVLLDIMIDGHAVARIAANTWRGDLEAAGKGDGRCAFAYEFATPLGVEAAQTLTIRAVDGPELLRVVVRPEPTDPGALAGYLDSCDGDKVYGWACDSAWPEHAVLLAVFVGTTPAGLVRAIEYRADLEAAGFGEGRHGFTFPISDHATGGETVTIRRAADDALLGSVTVPLRERLAA